MIKVNNCFISIKAVFKKDSITTGSLVLQIVLCTHVTTNILPIFIGNSLSRYNESYRCKATFFNYHSISDTFIINATFNQYHQQSLQLLKSQRPPPNFTQCLLRCFLQDNTRLHPSKPTEVNKNLLTNALYNFSLHSQRYRWFRSENPISSNDPLSNISLQPIRYILK